MLQNLFWAVGYKVVAIPLADEVLAPVRILLSPVVGAVLMSFSMIAVALNAQFLRRLGLRPVALENRTSHSGRPNHRSVAVEDLLPALRRASHLSPSPWTVRSTCSLPCASEASTGGAWRSRAP